MGELKYAVEMRMRFIDFLVAQYGTINRSVLVDYFGISMPAASRDLGDYLKLAPGNMVYDLNAKTYVRGVNFKRIYP
jgi:hypothetical protein